MMAKTMHCLFAGQGGARQVAWRTRAGCGPGHRRRPQRRHSRRTAQTRAVPSALVRSGQRPGRRRHAAAAADRS